MINETDVPLAKLELLDAVQRLGLNYRFYNDVKQAIDVIYNSTDAWLNDDLHSTALRFRILREHGYAVPQDVFRTFIDDDTGNFEANLSEDVKGLLSLYEASFFGFQGEEIIDKATAFSTTHLKNSVNNGRLSSDMAAKVNHALDMPLHWKLPRAEAIWYINAYEKEQNMNPDLLRDYGTELIVKGKVNLEVNILNNNYSWWTETGLGKTSFARDRWDITEIDKLPNNLKTVLLAVFNTTNQIGFWTLQERDFNIIPYLSKQWTNMCKAFLKEAKWYYSGYKPTLEEYIENGAVSGAAPIVLFCAYFLTAEKIITVEALDYIDKLPSIMWCSSMILRLTNDLGTSSEELARGDSLKAVQCYMNDTGASEAESRKYVDNIVHETWKILNKDLLGSYPFGEPFLTANPNLARTTQTFYQYGDGLGIPQNWIKDLLKSLLVEPFTL
ncbi:hypothetical protein AgCh_003686 [Apium graveolens]